MEICLSSTAESWGQFCRRPVKEGHVERENNEGRSPRRVSSHHEGQGRVKGFPGIRRVGKSDDQEVSGLLSVGIGFLGL